MLTLSSEQRVVLCLQPTDMRKGFLSLSRLIRDSGQRLTEDIWFVFFSRRKDRVKILCWDGDGYALFYKKLEEGTFRIEYQETGEQQELITGVDLGKLLSGMSLKRIQLQKKVAEGILMV